MRRRRDEGLGGGAHRRTGGGTARGGSVNLRSRGSERGGRFVIVGCGWSGCGRGEGGGRRAGGGGRTRGEGWGGGEGGGIGRGGEGFFEDYIIVFLVGILFDFFLSKITSPP